MIGVVVFQTIYEYCTDLLGLRAHTQHKIVYISNTRCSNYLVFWLLKQLVKDSLLSECLNISADW